MDATIKSLQNYTEPSACFFYINGILNDKNDVETTAKRIQNVVNQEVRFYHNDTATTGKLIRVIAPLVGGALLCGYAAHAEKKGRGTKESRLGGVLGLGLLVWGVKEYANMQQKKNEHAAKIVEQIQTFCDENPLSQCNLVLHSQGADVGERVLNLLGQNYRDRVRVVTLGGMVTIAEKSCQFVMNFKLNTDPVPNGVAPALNLVSKTIDGCKREICHIKSESAGTFAHGAAAYLEHPVVQKVLTTLAEPVAFKAVRR